MGHILLWGVLIAVTLYALHRIAIKMEEAGWIYYRKKNQSGALGNAFLQIQALFEPEKRHVAEVRKRKPPRDQTAGDPPEGS